MTHADLHTDRYKPTPTHTLSHTHTLIHTHTSSLSFRHPSSFESVRRMPETEVWSESQFMCGCGYVIGESLKYCHNTQHNFIVSDGKLIVFVGSSKYTKRQNSLLFGPSRLHRAEKHARAHILTEYTHTLRPHTHKPASPTPSPPPPLSHSQILALTH